MDRPPLRVLLVEDSLADATVILAEIRQEFPDVDSKRVETHSQMKAALTQRAWDIVLCDNLLPGFSLKEAIAVLQESGRDIPLIIVSGTLDEDDAVTALKMGAQDFLVKGRLARLVPAIQRELRDARTRREHRQAEETVHRMQERFRVLTENAPDGIALVDKEGCLKLVSASARRIFGYGLDENPDLDPSEHTHPDDRPAFFTTLAGVTRNPANNPALQYRFKCKNGSWLWIESIFRNLLAVESVGAIVINFRDISDRQQLFDRLQKSNIELQQAYDSTIEGWSRALDLRDRETQGHTLRVTTMTLRLARAAGMTGEDLVHVRRGALLHDIGKLGVPDHILFKPGPLTDEEWATMRKHPTFAHELMAPIDYLHRALDIPYCHHERWDGTGYPRGLKGEQIPLAARLFSVVDVYDALRSERPYHSKWSKEDALAYIRSHAGTQFDPKSVELFLRVLNQSGDK